MSARSPCLLAVLLAACSSSSGGGGNAPTATIAFPFAGAVTDAAQVTVRGTTSDPQGDAISAVTVGGVAAASADGFATWQAVVPLVPGSNTILVAATDADGNANPNAANVVVVRQEILISTNGALAYDAVRDRVVYANALTAVSVADGTSAVITDGVSGSGPALDDPRLVAFDAGSDRLIVFQSNPMPPNDLIAVDGATGDRTLLSGASRGTGPDLGFVGPGTVDAGNGRLLCPDGDALLAVDLTTGDRTVLSQDGTAGTGPAFGSPQGVALDAATNRALVVDGTLNAVVAVDLANGNRTVVSDDSTGSGDPFTFPNHIVFDPLRSVAVVADPFPHPDGHRIVRVDLSSGDRTVLSGPSAGAGVPLVGPRVMVVDAARDRVYVSDNNDGRDAILAVSLANGDRTTVFESARGSGPFFDDTRDIAIDPARNRLLVSDGGSDGEAVLGVDLTTGDRTVISDATTGAGPVVQSERAITMDTVNDRIILIDSTNEVVVGIDPSSGDRTVITENGTGTGPDFGNARNLEIDAAGNRMLVADSTLHALMALDLATGARSVISDSVTGTGPDMAGPIDVALDAANGRALVVNPTGTGAPNLMWIDLATGDRTVLSDDMTGTGPALESPDGFALDLANDRVLCIDEFGSVNSILAVDLATGDRTVISDETTGLGPLVIGTGQQDVVLSPDGTVLFQINDGNSNFLFAIDLATGDRFVFSK